MSLEPRLYAAARALADLSQAELARAAGLSPQVVQRFESGSTDTRMSSIRSLENALRAAGVEIVGPTDRHTGGVMLLAKIVTSKTKRRRV